MVQVHQVCNMSTYRQIQKMFDQLNHLLINAEGYCEKSKEYTQFENLFWRAMSIMYHVNDDDNKYVKYFTWSSFNIPQSKNVDLAEKNVKQILETFIW